MRRDLVRRGVDRTLPTLRLARRVRQVEEGSRENALLAGPLADQVARLERSLLPVLEAASRRRAGAHVAEPGGHE